MKVDYGVHEKRKKSSAPAADGLRPRVARHVAIRAGVHVERRLDHLLGIRMDRVEVLSLLHRQAVVIAHREEVQRAILLRELPIVGDTPAHVEIEELLRLTLHGRHGLVDRREGVLFDDGGHVERPPHDVVVLPLAARQHLRKAEIEFEKEQPFWLEVGIANTRKNTKVSIEL